MHYAEEVARGVKYVLRADVMYRRLGAARSATTTHGPRGEAPVDCGRNGDAQSEGAPRGGRKGSSKRGKKR